MLKMFIAAVGGVALFIFLERWLPLRETPVTANDDLDQHAAENGNVLSAEVDNGTADDPVFADEDPMAFNTKPVQL